MSIQNPNLISEAVDHLGGPKAVAALCGLTSYQAIRKWEKNGLPRSEHSGETQYAETLEKASSGKYTKQKLLDASVQIRQARSS